MIVFPNSKINIGLNIVEKRADGFHNIETIMYPIELNDILEIELSNKTIFKNTGIIIDSKSDDNLCIKAYKLLQKDYNINDVNIHLHKIIPYGAGLGGGSSDATFTLKLLNQKFNLNLSNDSLYKYTSQLGSDCSFFINNKAVFAYQKGDVFKNIDLDLSGYKIVLIKPDFAVSTKIAYSNIKAKKAKHSLKDLIKLPIIEWKNYIKNDFEENVFNIYPEIKKIKDYLYKKGALYASMSGSGSSVFGIFDSKPSIIVNNQYFIWQNNNIGLQAI